MTKIWIAVGLRQKGEVGKKDRLRPGVVKNSWYGKILAGAPALHSGADIYLVMSSFVVRMLSPYSYRQQMTINYF